MHLNFPRAIAALDPSQPLVSILETYQIERPTENTQICQLCQLLAKNCEHTYETACLNFLQLDNFDRILK
jgi:hypothetical protein